MLLPELDEAKTINNVRKFFATDFLKLQSMAHISYVDVKSPIISGMPAVHSIDNNIEKTMEKHVHATKVLDQVVKACGGMDQIHRSILEKRCFKRLDWEKIKELTSYSRSRGNEILNEAFLQFAWAFVDVKDMRVFKKTYLSKR